MVISALDLHENPIVISSMDEAIFLIINKHLEELHDHIQTNSNTTSASQLLYEELKMLAALSAFREERRNIKVEMRTIIERVYEVIIKSLMKYKSNPLLKKVYPESLKIPRNWIKTKQKYIKHAIVSNFVQKYKQINIINRLNRCFLSDIF